MKSSSPGRRLDELVVALCLAPTRARAQALIMAGKVTVDGKTATKAGTRVAAEAEVALIEPDHPWASRGGLKLVAAIDRFGLSLENCVALDVGASTGGFTDVLLARGARRVYAVDVGRGLIVERLRHDPRVVLLEETNARYLDSTQIPEPIEFLVGDVSFISLTLILPAVTLLMAPGASAVLLVKPQFEAERGEVGKGGIVRDEAVRLRALERVRAAAVGLGWQEVGAMDSPIRGQQGNVEYLLALRR